MKKHFKEGNCVSLKNKSGKSLKLIIIFVISLPQIILFSQVPLNGFCRIKEINIPPNQTNFIPVDYSGDGYRGFVIYNQKSNKYTALTYDSKSKSFHRNDKYMSFVPCNFHPLSFNETSGKNFAFASRKNLVAGIVNFNREGSVWIKSKMSFKSYPENIDVGDIEHNSKQDILLSGIVFKGLLVLRQTKKGLAADTIDGAGHFNYSTFIDLDYDSYIDVAAVDFLTNKLHLYYNDHSGGFVEQRSIQLNDQISELKCADYNSDGFNDFVFIKNGMINAMLGDSVSSFSRNVILDTQTRVDKYAVFDFNGDGFNDIAFINKNDGTVGISFAESTSKFYPPIFYMRRKGIADLNAFVDRGGRKLALLNRNGKIYLIDKIAGNEDEFAIAAGIQPSLVGSFDYLNDNSPDYFAVDAIENKINFYLSARSNLFDKYFSYKIFQNYSRVEVDELNPVIKTFYCYSINDRVIEMLRVNFENGDMSKRVLYTDGPIEDLKLTSDRLKDRQTIFVLINKNDELSLQSFDFRDFRYTRSGLDSIAVGVEAAAISFNIFKEIYYFQKKDLIMNLNKLTMRSEYEKPVVLSSTEIDGNTNFGFEIIGSLYNTPKENAVVSIISKKDMSDVKVIFGKKNKTFTIKRFIASQGYTKLYYDENGLEMFLYDMQTGRFKRVSISDNPAQIITSDLFESKSVNSYIVSRIKSLKELFIYSDSYNSQIKFRNVR